MPLYSNTSPGIVLAPWATKKKANHLLEAGQAYYSLSKETWITTAMFSNCPDGRIRKGAASIARQTQKVLMDGKIFHKVHHGYQRLGTENWRLYPNRSRCKLFEDIPGSTALLCSLDFMHNKYLGCDQYCFGSVMLLLSK